MHSMEPQEMCGICGFGRYNWRHQPYYRQHPVYASSCHLFNGGVKAHKLLRCACSHYWFVHDDDASIDGCLACLLDGTENYCGEFKGLRSSGSLRGVHE